jgi:hypothetical protein
VTGAPQVKNIRPLLSSLLIFTAGAYGHVQCPAAKIRVKEQTAQRAAAAALKSAPR